MRVDELEGLPCQCKIQEMTAAQKEHLQRWLLIMRKRLEYGLGKALFISGVLDAPTPEQEAKMLDVIWQALFRIPLWEILEDEKAVKQFIEGKMAPTTMDDIFQDIRDA